MLILRLYVIGKRNDVLLLVNIVFVFDIGKDYSL